MPEVLSKPVQRLITEHFDSVESLEVLLFLHAHADTEWSAGSVSRELRGNPASVAKRLADLCLQGLLSLRVDPDLLYRYCPNDPGIEAAVAELAAIYVRHRARVIGMIFSKPNEKITVFADAFRLRDEEKQE